VGEKLTPAEQATNIGEIDDDSLPGFGEMRSSGLGAEERGLEIGVEGGVPGLLGSGTEFGFEEIGGVVDEDVEAVEVADGLIDEILDLGDVGEVGGNGDGALAELLDFVDGVAGFGFGAAVVDGDVGALAARRRATKRPMRLAAPVTRATRPESLFSSGMDRSHNSTGKGSTTPAKITTVRGEAMKLDLLAIAAHPDDVELTCGGTLLKMAQRGYTTGILDLTAGEMEREERQRRVRRKRRVRRRF